MKLIHKISYVTLGMIFAYAFSYIYTFFMTKLDKSFGMYNYDVENLDIRIKLLPWTLLFNLLFLLIVTILFTKLKEKYPFLRYFAYGIFFFIILGIFYPFQFRVI